MLPIARSHPVIRQPVTLRAWAALPAAGAWDATPLELAIAGYKSMLLYLSYERGDVNGGFDFQLQVSPYAADQPARNWFTQGLYVSGVVAAATDTQSRIQREYVTYEVTGAGVESFVYGAIEVGIAVERLRIVARESGVVATPGTLEIIGLFGLEA